MKKTISILFLVGLAVGTYFILQRSKFHECEGKIFGTTYHIKYAATHDFSADITATLLEVDAALSMFNDTSALSRFNRNEAFPANPMFEEVITTGLQVSRETDGAFDMTVAPLVNAWGFGFKNKDSITVSLIDSLRQNVGYQKITTSGRGKTFAVSKEQPLVAIDCGAIAKGFGVQQVAKMLSAKGCVNYMVEIGGEIAVKGSNPDNKPWTLGINKPVDDATNTNNELQQVIRLTDCGIATSGNYRNFYYNGGKKYAHTIDPATGYPVQHSLLSATVVHPSCTLADAYATAFMVMGLDKARKFTEANKQVEAYLIYSDDDGNLQTWYSSGFKKYLAE